MVSEKLKGKKVVYIDRTNHTCYPKNCPEPGTIGTVIRINSSNDDIEIQWPKGSTSEDDCWWHEESEIAVLQMDEKEKAGHWEPIGIFNLPCNGETVRYAREIDINMDNKFAKDFNMSIGDEYIVCYRGYYFGVIKNENDANWINSSDYPSRFDRWVEE